MDFYVDDDIQELEEMKEGFSSQKERTEELDKMLLEAKDIAKNNMKKYKRSQMIDDDDLNSDDNNNNKNKKVKSKFNQYNYFQRRNIINRIRRGKAKKK